MDVLAGGQVHHRVAAPADRPHQFFHFLGDARGHRAVADVGVDLGEEVAADDHRLAFRVIDVVGQHRTAAGDFLAHEFRGDELLDRRAECFARMLLQQCGITDRLQPLVLADGDEFHFRGDDAAARVVHLGDVGTGLRAAWQAARGETHRVQLGIVLARTAERRAEAIQLFGVVALLHPAATQCRQADRQVDAHVRIGVRAGGVVDGDRCVLFATEHSGRAGQRDLAHRHLQVRPRAGHVDLARAGYGPGHGLGELLGLLLQGRELCVHRASSRKVRDEAAAHCTRARTAPRWSLGGIGVRLHCKASLRRYEPDQVPRDYLNRGHKAAVPPLLGAH
ncbi:hypothetical protein D3C81_1162240 [compost metagenome]